MGLRHVGEPTSRPPSQTQMLERMVTFSRCLCHSLS